EDSRVRVSAIRSLGNLKDKRAADKLLQRGKMLLAAYKKSKSAVPNEKSELLEIATTLGRILQNAQTEEAVSFFGELREADGFQSPETEIALVRVFSVEYPVATPDFKKMFAPPTSPARFARNTRVLSSFIQGFGEAANTAVTDDNKGWRDNSADVLRKFIKDSIFLDAKIDRKTAAFVMPDALRGFANFKTDDLTQILRGSLEHKDVFVRATAAELLGDTAPSKENVEALKAAFSAISLQQLMPDKEYNDAQLAIITALAKQDKEKQEVKVLFPIALQAPDFLVRRHTANVIKQYGLEMESPATEAVTYVNVVMSRKSKKSTKLGQILNTNADYTRAVSRKNAKAILTTDKGIFTIDLLPEDAPLTVDNFIKLAKAKYFNGLAIHRVVPNFVMQDGDPRGDGNGGPGWQIRCELNMVEYERGAVGMALSGKDTGGSQWFVTHSPQPHLDGGYTVFGRVNETHMKVVDNLVRGDKILSVRIIENTLTAPKMNNKQKSKTKK
ncbi:MAG: peptidylprolyl isomerase, partial [Acidobacteriota bacterium]|nr:peptidylprolyl isomerase [Acidobacteriota bacterium]